VTSGSLRARLCVAALVLPAAHVSAETPRDDSARPAALSELSSLRWEYRVLLVVDSETVRSDLAALESRRTDVLERDLLWFVLKAERVQSNYPGALSPGLPAQLREHAGEAEPVVLLGKDGGVKLRAGQLDLDAVFARIDSMPMRRREMRRQAAQDVGETGDSI
jgi:hypothetical protein